MRNNERDTVIRNGVRMSRIKADLEGAKSSLEVYKHNYERSQEAVAQLRGLLNNLLELDPTLERFRVDIEAFGWYATRDWDYDGIAAALEFERNRKNAAKYTATPEEATA